MRYLVFLLIAYISFSCQRKKSNLDNNDLLYSIDTVKIDSKGQLLDLTRFIEISSLEDSKRSIFLYNEFDHSIDEVDLEAFVTTNHYEFEKEGPDGTGGYFYDFNVLSNGTFFIKSYKKSAVFNREGDLIHEIDWMNSIDSEGLKFGEIPEKQILSSNGSKSFGLSFDQENRKVFLDILSVKEGTVIQSELNLQESYSDLILEAEDPDYVFVDPQVYLNFENNCIIISSEFSNEILLYNLDGNLKKTIRYDSKLTPNRVKKLNKGTVGSMDQLKRDFQHFMEQIRFYPPVWDDVNKRYFRLSSITIFSDNEKDDFPAEKSNTKVFLSVFDEKFNLISESGIPELNYEYGKYFSKGGKFWVYQNIHDELGFMVLDL